MSQVETACRNAIRRVEQWEQAQLCLYTGRSIMDKHGRRMQTDPAVATVAFAQAAYAARQRVGTFALLTEGDLKRQMSEIALRNLVDPTVSVMQHLSPNGLHPNAYVSEEGDRFRAELTERYTQVVGEPPVTVPTERETFEGTSGAQRHVTDHARRLMLEIASAMFVQAKHLYQNMTPDTDAGYGNVTDCVERHQAETESVLLDMLRTQVNEPKLSAERREAAERLAGERGAFLVRETRRFLNLTNVEGLEDSYDWWAIPDITKALMVTTSTQAA